jgi:hypothetical protein
MNFCSSEYSVTSETELLVDNRTFEEYKKEKKSFDNYRILKAIFYSVIEITMASLFYADIVSDIMLCIKYKKENRNDWFMLTLLFVLLPIILNSTIIIISYARNFKLSLLRIFCIILQLEMLSWYVILRIIFFVLMNKISFKDVSKYKTDMDSIEGK